MIENGFIKFYADWCGPCKVVAPLLKKVAAEHNLELLEVDVDADPEMAADYNVKSIPAVVAVKDGEPIDFKVGSMTEEVYSKMAEAIKE